MNETIDWNSIWMEKQRLCTGSGWGRECWQTWEDESAALEYFNMSQGRPLARQRIDDLCSVIEPDWRVLDIGAGPGNIAVPLSASCAHVCAVEPARGMALMLNRQIEAGSIKNIHLVNKRWDDVIPDTDLDCPYDLSLASFSLGMRDLRGSIEKMTAVTRREIVIYWHAGLQSWDRHKIALWPLLHGLEYHPCPQSDILFNVLYSMEIYPDVRVLRSNTEMVYASFDDAFEQFARRHDVINDRQRGILTDYLARRLTKKDSQFVMPRRDTSMRFSWQI